MIAIAWISGVALAADAGKLIGVDWLAYAKPWRADICATEMIQSSRANEVAQRIQRSQERIFAIAKNRGMASEHLRGLIADANVTPSELDSLDALIRDYALLASLDLRGDPTSDHPDRELKHVATIAEKVCGTLAKRRKVSYKELEQELANCGDYAIIANDPRAFVQLVSDHVVAIQNSHKRSVIQNRVAAMAQPGRETAAKSGRKAAEPSLLNDERLKLARKSIGELSIRSASLDEYQEDCAAGLL